VRRSLLASELGSTGLHAAESGCRTQANTQIRRLRHLIYAVSFKRFSRMELVAPPAAPSVGRLGPRQVSAMAIFPPNKPDARIDTSHSRLYVVGLFLNLVPIVFLVLTLCVVTRVLQGSITGFAVACAISYAVYLVRGLRSGTAESLRNQMEPTTLVQTVSQIRSTPPAITLTVRCW
jgi:hypothetical protein